MIRDKAKQKQVDDGGSPATSANCHKDFRFAPPLLFRRVLCANVSGRARSEFRRFTALLAAGLASLILLAFNATAFNTSDVFQPAPQDPPPDIQVTRVRALHELRAESRAESQAAPRTDVEIRWTALVPHGTKIEAFEVLLEARYTDGSRGVARIRHLKPFARAVLLSLATHPRENNAAVLGDFKASVKVNFSVASSVAVFHDVPLTDSTSTADLSASNAGEPEVRPEILITAAKLVPQGCISRHHCVDIKWSASAANNITINEFAVSLIALHKNGTRVTDSKIVSSRSRNARLLAGSIDSEVLSLRIAVLTSFFVRDSRTAVNTGIFI